MLDKLTEQEQKEYEKLQWLERFWKLAWKPLPKHVEDKLEEFRKKLRESVWVSNLKLREYRNLWEEKISIDDYEIKKEIMEFVEKIKVKVDVDGDWSRLIEFKLWNKTYKILDSKLENHTDDEYRWHLKGSSITEIDKDCVKLWWMRGDNVEEWKNEKLKEYVKDKQKEWLHIPSVWEVIQLLEELKKQVNVSYGEKLLISTLMCLIGIDWVYWLGSTSVKPEDGRYFITCIDTDQYTHHDLWNEAAWGLIMMSCN